MAETVQAPIYRHAMLVRQSMLRRDARLLNLITKDYIAAYAEVKKQIKALQDAIALAEPTLGQLLQMQQYRNLLDAMRTEMAAYAVMLEDNIQAAVEKEIGIALDDALGYMKAGLPGLDDIGLMIDWGRLNTEGVINMFGYLDSDGPLYAAIRHMYTDDAVEEVRNAIMNGYIRGMNPREVYRMITKATQRPLNWGLQMARTSMINANRAASMASFRANRKVVTGWKWSAVVGDERTCMGCIAMHGSIHSLDETLGDHHNGRCVSIPLTKTWAELGMEGRDADDLEAMKQEEWYKKLDPDQKQAFNAQFVTGETWFNGLTSDAQLGFMGEAKWHAWNDGLFTFDKLAKQYNDRIYGTLWREASLKELIGIENAKRYYVNSAVRAW